MDGLCIYQYWYLNTMGWLPSNKIKQQFICYNNGKVKWTILVVWNTENEIIHWNFSKLYTHSHMHTQKKSDITSYYDFRATKTEETWRFCSSKLYTERLLTFTTYSMYNEHKSKTKLHKSFPSKLYTEWLLIFTTYSKYNKQKSRTKLHKSFLQQCWEGKVQCSNIHS